jgi:hypothetical protein
MPFIYRPTTLFGWNIRSAWRTGRDGPDAAARSGRPEPRERWVPGPPIRVAAVVAEAVAAEPVAAEEAVAEEAVAAADVGRHRRARASTCTPVTICDSLRLA